MTVSIIDESKLADVPVVDLVGDKGVFKRLVEAAPEGAVKPTDGQVVSIHYRGTLLEDVTEGGETALRKSGAEFDSSYKRNEPFSFVLGAGQVIKGFDIAVRSMQIGERSVFDIRSDLAYGPRGAGAGIPPNADLRFDLRLEAAEDKRRTAAELSPAARLQVALEAKEKGNAFFKENALPKAIEEYRYAISLFDDAGGADFIPEDSLTAAIAEGPGEPVEQARPIALSCRLNLAACHLRLSQWQEARIQAEAALKLEPENCKALFRCGVALLNLHEYDRAKHLLKEAARFEPKNAEIIKQIALVSVRAVLGSNSSFPAVVFALVYSHLIYAPSDVHAVYGAK